MTELTDYQLMEELKRRFDERDYTLVELQRLNKELMEVNTKLTISEALKSHFLSNISNEIVNPFTAIVGLARNISEMDESQLKQIKKMASLIFSEAFHLDFQLKNIFMAASIEAGQIQPEYKNIDVLELINDLVDTYTFDLMQEETRIVVIQDMPVTTCLADPEKLELILANLINNAILFSESGKTITIVVEMKENLEISVNDQGIGIKADDLGKIFNRFNRLENAINSVNRGNGLGLSVCKALTDIMGGSIEVTSEVGVGSNFKLILPLPKTNNEGNTDYSNSGNITMF